MKESILIINDEEDVRLLMKLPLEEKGYQIYEGESGAKGLELAEKMKPDLILLDVIMPGMDGYSTCQKLKSEPHTQNIPVIFVSSLTDSNDKIKGLQVGGVDFVNRATDASELLARVQTHLKIQSLNKQLTDSNIKLVEKQKILDEDLQAAALIQRSLLPPACQKIANIDFSWACLPSQRVGGDIFNVIPCGQDYVLFYMIDVCGHGIPSAMITVSISQYLFQLNLFSQDPIDPHELISKLEKEYPFDRFEKFFTIFYMILNKKTGKLTYYNAGHPPAALLAAEKEIELLRGEGAIIGLNENMACKNFDKQLEKGNKIVLYTDGIIEYQNELGVQYGETRFFQLLEQLKRLPPSDMLPAIEESVKKFGNNAPQQDDISLICIEYN